MRRAVRGIIRLIAACLAGFGLLEIGFAFVQHWVRKGDLNWWHLVIGTILILLGVFLFMASASLAEQLTDDVEDDEP